MTNNNTNSATQEHEHHEGVSIYIAVFLALCFLTSMSFLTYFDFWRERVPVEASRVFMIAVSCCKALLVILFFMHLKWEANWKWVLTIPASLMAIFLMLVLIPDIGLRMRHASYERMIHAAEMPVETPGEHSDHEEHNEPAKHDAKRPAA